MYHGTGSQLLRLYLAPPIKESMYHGAESQLLRLYLAPPIKESMYHGAESAEYWVTVGAKHLQHTPAPM